MALSQKVKDLILGLIGGDPDNQSEIVTNLNLGSTAVQPDGSVPFTAEVSGIDPIKATSLSTKNYFDVRITPWKNDIMFTYASSFGTISAQDIRYRRVLDTLEVVGTFTMGTVVSGGTYIQLPVGYTIDTTKVNSVANSMLGFWNNIATAAVATDTFASDQGGVLYYDGSNTNRLYLAAKSISNGYQNMNAVSAGFTAGNNCSFRFSIPISQWA